MDETKKEMVIRDDEYIEWANDRCSSNVEPSIISCGCNQLYGLDRDEITGMLCGAACDMDNSAFLVFSDANKREGGEQLAGVIERNKLGPITSLPTRKNPNSGNKIKVWLWAPDHKAIKAYLIRNNKKDIEDYVKDIRGGVHRPQWLRGSSTFESYDYDDEL